MQTFTIYILDSISPTEHCVVLGDVLRAVDPQERRHVPVLDAVIEFIAEFAPLLYANFQKDLNTSSIL